jgi:hypothetical protein
MDEAPEETRSGFSVKADAISRTEPRMAWADVIGNTKRTIKATTNFVKALDR